MNFVPKKVENVLIDTLNRDEYSLYKLHLELNNIDKLINQYDELNDGEKYYLLNRYYYIIYDIKDILALVNKINDTKYTKFVDLSTKMEVEYYDCKGNGSNFKWWPTYNKIHYICATNKNIELSTNDYSYNKIVKMINNKTLFPIQSFTTEIDKYSSNRECFKRIKTLRYYGVSIDDLDFNNNNVNDLKMYNSHYNIDVDVSQVSAIMSLIENSIDKKMIYLNIKTYLNDLIKFIKKEGNDIDKQGIYKLREYYKENYKKMK